MRVLPATQYAFRQATQELNTVAFPSAIRTLASVVASITMIVTIYLGYRKCMRGRDDSFTAGRQQQQSLGIPLASYDAPGRTLSDEYLPVYVGNGRYIYVSRNELPRDPPNVLRRDSNVPPRFDTSVLKKFEAANEERHQSCPICLEQLHEEPVSAGQCLHLMHNSCLVSWLNKDANSNCPVCRVRIMESASFDGLGAKVTELVSVVQPVSETMERLNAESGPHREDDVRLLLADNSLGAQAETESASQRIRNESIENDNENSAEHDYSQNANQRWEARNDEVTHQSRPHDSDAGVLSAQEVMGSTIGGASGAVTRAGSDREVAVANN